MPLHASLSPPQSTTPTPARGSYAVSRFALYRILSLLCSRHGNNPLWEAQLHDALLAAFTELQFIVLHCCGAVIAGTSFVTLATKLELVAVGTRRL